MLAVYGATGYTGKWIVRGLAARGVDFRIPGEAMSNVVSIGIIGALLIGATLLLYVIGMGINSKGGEIASGVVQGVPLSKEFRWLTLFQIQVPLVLLSGIFSLLVGFMFQQLALNIEDPRVNALAMMCSLMYFATAFLILTAGSIGTLHLAATLRKSTRD
jgi:uncharacterized membrane protein